MISVLVALAVLAVAGLLALRATTRIEATTATLATLSTAPWRQACTDVDHATDTLVAQLSSRIDG